MQEDQNDLLAGSAQMNDRASVCRALGGGEEEVVHRDSVVGIDDLDRKGTNSQYAHIYDKNGKPVGK